MSGGHRGRGPRGGPDDRSSEAIAVGDVVDGLFRRRELARGVPAGRLHREWPAVVGDRLADVSSPIRLDRGTLVVAVDSGPWGAQLSFLSGEVLRRANEVLGNDVVTRVQLVVDPARARARRSSSGPADPAADVPREPLGRNDLGDPPFAAG